MCDFCVVSASTPVTVNMPSSPISTVSPSGFSSSNSLLAACLVRTTEYGADNAVTGSPYCSLYSKKIEDFGIGKESGKRYVNVLTFKLEPMVAETTFQANYHFKPCVLFRQLVPQRHCGGGILTSFHFFSLPVDIDG